MRRWVSGLMFLVLVVWVVSPAAGQAADPRARVVIDGSELILDVPPAFIGDRLVVPLRAIFEALGAEIEWDGATRTVTARKGPRTVVLMVGSPTATVDGKSVTLAVPAVIVENRTMVPLRFVAEALGGEVSWDGAARTAIITSAQVAQPTPSAEIPPSVQPPPAATISGVTARAGALRVPQGQSTDLGASVTGTGAFDTGVTWSVVQGGGTLSAATGASVRFTAPSAPGAAVIRAAATGDPTKYQELTLNVPATREVKLVSAEGLIRKPAYLFDLEGKTLRFTPTAGGYTLQILPLAWQESGTGLNAGTLPFAFPFGGQNWTQFHINPYGNITFGQPESESWKVRNQWADGTVSTMAAAIDARAVAGNEKMIAVLWGIYDQQKSRATARADKDGLIVTWESVRAGGEETGPAPPAGTNLYQAVLRPDGSIDLSYKQVAERDGIVGLFTGEVGAGAVLDSLDDPADPQPEIDVRKVAISEAGTSIRIAMTMAADVPARAETGSLMHRVNLQYGGRQCEVWAEVKTTVKAAGSCGFTPGVRIRGQVVELFLPRAELAAHGSFGWYADVVWWGKDGWFDQVSFQNHRNVSVKPYALDLSTDKGAFAGNIFEVFHYPVFPKSAAETLKQIYTQYPAEDDLALVLLDFRVDALYGGGSGRGLINAAVKGIGLDEPCSATRAFAPIRTGSRTSRNWTELWVPLLQNGPWRKTWPTLRRQG